MTRRNFIKKGALYVPAIYGVVRAQSIPMGSGDGPHTVGGTLLTGLIAYWNLSEASGTRADSHSSGLDLTDNNSTGQAAGVGGAQTAADFVAASSNYLSRSNALSTALKVGAGSYTVAMWVYPNALIDEINIYSLGFTASRSGIEIQIKTSGEIRVKFRDNSSNSKTPISDNTSGGLYTAASWNLIVAKIDRTAGLITAKINNTPVVWFSDGTSNDISGVGTADNNSSDELHLGANAYSPPDIFFDGRMASVGVWAKVTSDTEDTTLYNAGTASLLYSDL